MMRFPTAVFAALALQMLGGCSFIYPGETETMLLEVSGPVEVAVDSFAGNVTIESDPRLSEAKVEVRYEARHGYDRYKEAEASLQHMSSDIALEPGDLGQRISVRTTTVHAEPGFHRAHLTITAPDIDGIYVRTNDGNVRAFHTRGEVDIETSNGDVAVQTNQPMIDPVTIVNNNGDIAFVITHNSRGNLDLAAVNGKVRAPIKSGSVRVAGPNSDRRVRALWNDGDNPVILRTTDGDIVFEVTDKPEGVVKRLIY